MKIATEIIGAYGEHRGVTCPYCGGRNYHTSWIGWVVKCPQCAEEYYLMRKVEVGQPNPTKEAESE